MNTDFGPRVQAAITKLLGLPFQENLIEFARASPITYVSAGDPPILIFHGDGDTLVPFSQSERLRDAYLKDGLKAELVKVGNADHDFEPVSNEPLSISVEEIHRRTADFFKRALR